MDYSQDWRADAYPDEWTPPFAISRQQRDAQIEYEKDEIWNFKVTPSEN